MNKPTLPLAVALAFGVLASARGEEVIPHAQDQPPGPPLSPREAVERMTVPEGFTVEVVAAEPDLVNPVAMCFDERGRIWVTESLEYPRFEAGPGRDRIKVLEDTDGDGRADKFTVFAEGLNIPSGIAVGHGGVWVANAPDILFLQDTDGDGKADKREVVVTGFGQHDTHELPNSLTWGPDGYLYGLNGVFNRSVVEQDGKQFDFTCAVWRIDPRTRKFELFAEGTSNPWGIAFNENGDLFISACVIDHLWHITQTGYYTRQGGPYPPNTWPMGSIVDHTHQKAAYCGIVWFDSHAYPEQYRGKLYMGNIHGGCINADALERDGSTYKATALPDLLTANDAWFMPVAQKVGPDGCLYILDWYDRYHCYQDAMRDAKGIDRLKGRLYRLRYIGTEPRSVSERSGAFNLGAESDDQLIARLNDPNVFIRETAQRLLNERDNPDTRNKLQSLAIDPATTQKAAMHAVWAALSAQAPEPEFHLALLKHDNPAFRSWAVRAAGNHGAVPERVREALEALAGDPAPEVRLQLAIAAGRLEGINRTALLSSAFTTNKADRLIPHIVWQNLRPLVLNDPAAFAAQLLGGEWGDRGPASGVIGHALEAIYSSPSLSDELLIDLPVALIANHRAGEGPGIAHHCLDLVRRRLVEGTLEPARKGRLIASLKAAFEPIFKNTSSDLYKHAVLVAATWGDPAIIEDARELARTRIDAFESLIVAGDLALPRIAEEVLAGDRPESFKRSFLATLGGWDDPRVGTIVLGAYPELDPPIRPIAIDLLTQRPPWTAALLDAIANQKLAKETLNLNQVRKLAASSDDKVRKQVEAIWGRVRTDRNPDRENVIHHTRQLLSKTSGDASRGKQVFARVCAQCHVLHGEGQLIGPDLTGSGRGSFEQLLSNVLDPNLVVGDAYQLRTVTMKDGRVLAGMVAEDNEQRIVLKVLGGQSESLPRDQVAKVETLPLSFMPEGLEQSMTEQELADLFKYLMMDAQPQ